jgi:hypothetical protein
VRPGAQYATTIDLGGKSSGDPRVDRTSKALEDILTKVADEMPDGAGPVYGIAVHFAFANAVRAAELLGIGRDDVEQSFDEKKIVRYALDGSVRTDISLWDESHTKVIAIYDLKTGNATLSTARRLQLRSNVPGGFDAHVIVLRIRRLSELFSP